MTADPRYTHAPGACSRGYRIVSRLLAELAPAGEKPSRAEVRRRARKWRRDHTPEAERIRQDAARVRDIAAGIR